MRRTKSGAYVSRVRIPKDVRDDYAQLYGQRWEAKVFIPSGTSRTKANRRYGEWLAEHKGRVLTIRLAQCGEGIDLSHKDAVALAGQWYLWFVAKHEDAPEDPESWHVGLWAVIDELQKHAPNEVREPPWNNLDWAQDLEVRAGLRPVIADWAFTSQFLANRGLVLTNPARALFLDRVLDNYLAALSLLERRAKGDFSPDKLPKSFPQFTADKPPATTNDQTPWTLFEAWVKERDPSNATIESWNTVFRAMSRRFRNGAHAITPERGQKWLDGLVTKKRSALTVRNTWLRASKAVFRWARRRKLVATDPFSEAIVDIPRRKRHRRTKAFKQRELRKILRAASTFIDTSKPNNAAKRWVPWLLAYTGARPQEITQLRGQDVQFTKGTWALNLTPPAGTEARRVPLHAHIIEQGFLKFAKSRGTGPLFFRPRGNQTPNSDPTKRKKAPAAQVRQKLADWVRQIGVTDRKLSPNHVWRHTFKQIGTRRNLSEKVIDSICGHAPATEGRGYGQPTLSDKADIVARFPRYHVGKKKPNNRRAPP